jgi:hypothetical protein
LVGRKSANLAEEASLLADEFSFAKDSSWDSLDFRLYNRQQPDPGTGHMASKSQRKAIRTHRRRAAARGLVRVEVQAPKRDAGLIRAIAGTLRGEAGKAAALRSTLAQALMHPEAETAFDIFGSELPDEAFAGVFDQTRQGNWREVDL